MKTEVTKYDYNNSGITFTGRDDVMINATEMAKAFGKRPVDWLRLPSTEDFIKTLSEVRKSHFTNLIVTQKGNYSDGTNQGTWFHEDVAIEFARWLSPEFAIWCNDRIKEILKNRISEQSEEIKRLQNMAPFPVCKRCVTVRTQANFLSTYTGHKIGQNKLFEILRQWEYLQRNETHKNEPRQRYIDKGYFEVQNKDEHIVTMVTPKGQARIAKRYVAEYCRPPICIPLF